MPQPTQSSRNEQIFRKVLEGVPYKSIAHEHGITDTRVDQIFKDQAKQRLPAIFNSVPPGRGYSKRFLDAMKGQQP